MFNILKTTNDIEIKKHTKFNRSYGNVMEKVIINKIYWLPHIFYVTLYSLVKNSTNRGPEGKSKRERPG